MEIGDRIKLIATHKAKTQKEFAKMMGWTPSYLSKLISSQQQGVGLTPIMQILEKFEDVDARWLLFGKGYMFGGIEQGILRRINFLLDLEKYISVMNEKELNAYLDAIQGKDASIFNDETLRKWQDMLLLKNSERDAMIYEAMKRNAEIVNRKNAQRD